MCHDTKESSNDGCIEIIIDLLTFILKKNESIVFNFQTKEEELFGNVIHSNSMEEFLQCIGHRVKLRNFEGYRGGLDTIHEQTGLESLYSQYHGRNIMFHVSTMLPYTEGDTQQVREWFTL